MEIYPTTYVNLKAEAEAKGLSLLHVDRGGTYELFATCALYGLRADVSAPADVSDFVATLLASSRAVGSEREAIGLSMTPNVVVNVSNQPRTREDGAVYAVPKPSGFGLVMCDRDMRINVCVVDPAAAVEDLKINTQTNKEEAWDELRLVGVYKSVAGVMTACADQADADANGVLSAWDFAARQPGTGAAILYELRDGLLYVDAALPPTEVWDHRAYAVVAPAIPGFMGGSVAVFDGYLGANPDNVIAALSPQATVLDPAGPAGPAGATIRLYVVHPAGSKLSHVLRLVMYRAPGTF